MRLGRAIPIGIHVLMALLLLACDLKITPEPKAQTAREMGMVAGEESPFVAIAQDVLPSVVNIAAERAPEEAEDYDYPFRDFFKDFERFFREMPPFREENRTSLGSGVVVSEDGYVLTNNHVVREADKIVVTFSDKTFYKGDDVQVVGTDARTDLAVLKVRADRRFPAVRLGDSDRIRIGDWALAIGNPLGFEGSVTVGVISAKGRSGLSLPQGPTQQDFIQTDASINPGNSGGPLLNMKGEVIGINTAIASRTGFSQGIGFAIPINLAKGVYTQLIERGEVVRGWLGVYIEELTGDLIEALGQREGVLVNEVVTGSPAEAAGIEPGDVIVEFEGVKTQSVPELQGAVAQRAPGTDSEIVVVRERQEKRLTVTLGTLPDEVASAGPGERPRESGWLGLRVVSPRSEDARRFGFDVEGGVVVLDVESGSAAARAGVIPGDVILSIEKRKVEDLDSYRAIEDELREKKGPFLFWIQTGGRKRFVAVSTD
jgi:serine protease Do